MEKNSTQQLTEQLIQKLLEKSQEAFIMAIEIYNKPTLKYRVEGFSFFICNAWELLLKAYIIEKHGNESIYYKDSPNRTLNLESSIKKVLTNEHDPLRKNLERIIELRNMSTHFIVEEYELLYVPLFQACVINYTNKLLSYFNIDITDSLNGNFLTLSVKLSDINNADIQARYPSEITSKLLHTKQLIDDSIPIEGNSKYAITIHHDWELVKNQKHATASFNITKDAKSAVYIMKKEVDPQHSHPFKTKKCIELINTWIQKEHIPFKSHTNTPSKFNSYHFQLFCSFFNIKSDASLCYSYKLSTQVQYSFSEKVVTIIKDKIKEDPEHIIQNLRESLKK